MDINDCLQWYPINTGMSSKEVLTNLLTRLQCAIESGVPGDIVELGCNTGTTSIFFQRMLNELDPSRQLHLYDSFQGLPDNSPHDNPNYGGPGTVRTSLDKVVETFRKNGLRTPPVHPGWFSELHECEFPKQVCFAFFDGDLYKSIMDSWRQVYHKLSPGAIVCVHDYNVDNWPGTAKACADFLADKPEKMTQPCFLLGVLVKQ